LRIFHRRNGSATPHTWECELFRGKPRSIVEYGLGVHNWPTQNVDARFAISNCCKTGPRAISLGHSEATIGDVSDDHIKTRKAIGGKLVVVAQLAASGQTALECSNVRLSAFKCNKEKTKQSRQRFGFIPPVLSNDQHTGRCSGGNCKHNRQRRQPRRKTDVFSSTIRFCARIGGRRFNKAQP